MFRIESAFCEVSRDGRRVTFTNTFRAIEVSQLRYQTIITSYVGFPQQTAAANVRLLHERARLWPGNCSHWLIQVGPIRPCLLASNLGTALTPSQHPYLPAARNTGYNSHTIGILQTVWENSTQRPTLFSVIDVLQTIHRRLWINDKMPRYSTTQALERVVCNEPCNCCIHSLHRKFR